MTATAFGTADRVVEVVDTGTVEVEVDGDTVVVVAVEVDGVPVVEAAIPPSSSPQAAARAKAASKTATFLIHRRVPLMNTASPAAASSNRVLRLLGARYEWP